MIFGAHMVFLSKFKMKISFVTTNQVEEQKVITIFTQGTLLQYSLSYKETKKWEYPNC